MEISRYSRATTSSHISRLNADQHRLGAQSSPELFDIWWIHKRQTKMNKAGSSETRKNMDPKCEGKHENTQTHTWQ